MVAEKSTTLRPPAVPNACSIRRTGFLTRGDVFMLRRFFHSQFFSKLFIELLPATIASAIGAYLINSYFRPQPPAAAANTEMVQILREQQTLLADYLKKST